MKDLSTLSIDELKKSLLSNGSKINMNEDSSMENVLFRIKHPYNLGSGVTNLLLTCRQSALLDNVKGIGRKS